MLKLDPGKKLGHDSIRLPNNSPGDDKVQIIDYAEAVDKAGGNAGLAKELFGMLLQELPDLRDKLRQAVETGDLQACWDHAHKIYGSTAYCGVPELGQAAAGLEAVIKAGDITALGGKFQLVDAAIERLLSEGPGHLEQAW